MILRLILKIQVSLKDILWVPMLFIEFHLTLDS